MKSKITLGLLAVGLVFAIGSFIINARAAKPEVAVNGTTTCSASGKCSCGLNGTKTCGSSCQKINKTCGCGK